MIIFKYIKNKLKRYANTLPALTKQPNMEAVMADSKVRNSTIQEQEIWKDIEGYKDAYQISNKGRVRNKRTDRIKKQSVKRGGGGYYYVNLCVDGNQKLFYVHRLLAIAFIPNSDNKPQINHIDGNTLNNDLSNLEWCTQKENNDHAIKNGLIDNVENGKHLNHVSGESHGRTFLTKNEILQIRSIYDQGFFTQKEISEAYNIHKGTVYDIVHRRTWIYV